MNRYRPAAGEKISIPVHFRFSSGLQSPGCHEGAVDCMFPSLDLKKST